MRISIDLFVEMRRKQLRGVSAGETFHLEVKGRTSLKEGKEV